MASKKIAVGPIRVFVNTTNETCPIRVNIPGGQTVSIDPWHVSAWNVVDGVCGICGMTMLEIATERSAAAARLQHEDRHRRLAERATPADAGKTRRIDVE